MKARSLRQIRGRTLCPDCFADDVEAVYARRAAVRANQSRQHFDRCTFAGPVRTDHQRNLAWIRVQRNAAQHRFASEALGYIFGSDHLFVVRAVCAELCARILQKYEVSGAGSWIELMPGITARSFAKRNNFNAGLSDKNAIAGKSRRNIPKRSSSRCGKSMIPSRSRSRSSSVSQRFPTP